MSPSSLVRSLAAMASLAALLATAGCSSCSDSTGGGDGGGGDGSTGGGQDARVVPTDCSTPRPDCPCDGAQLGQTSTCFSGTTNQLGKGACRAGTTTCGADHLWSACVGEVAPMTERCDAVNNDCDGVIDDGVLSSCGNCDLLCNQTGTSTNVPNRFMPTPQNSDGVSVNPSGNLVLNASELRSYFAWIANSGEGTMSKLDSRTGHEVARYATIRPQDPRVSGVTLPLWNEPCQFPGGSFPGAGNCGSRTAVDLNGDVWIANRAFGGQGTVTKVSSFPELCIDYNLNGRIDTSTDKNGNGVIDVVRDGATGWLVNPPPNVVDDPTAEFLGVWDECIVATIAVGPARAWPRALAIDSGDTGLPDPAGHPRITAGNVWVGTFNDPPSEGHGRYYQIAGDTLDIIADVAMPEGHHPYGAVITGDQILFSTHINLGDLVAVNTRAKVLKIYPGEDASGDIPRPAGMCAAAYGVGVDGRGRIWQAGWSCGGAFRFDPSAAAGQRWTQIVAPAEFGASRGIAADTAGGVWVAHSTDPGRITRIDADQAVITGSAILTSTIPPMQASGTIGAGIDFDNNIWAVNNGGSASKIIPSTCSFINNPTGTTGTCTVLNYPVGLAPYTYSDFTGFALRNFTAPRGRYTFRVEGCPLPSETNWELLEWTSSEPQGTSIEAKVRSADDEAQLAAAQVFGPYSPQPVALDEVPKGHFLEVELDLLTTDRSRSPILSGYRVRFHCPFEL